MSDIFLVGNQDRVLGLLGVPYGTIIVNDDHKVGPVHNMADGKRWLQRFVRESRITVDQAGALETQMSQAQLVPDFDALVARFNSYKPPGDHKQQRTFSTCTNPLCQVPEEFPHGWIVRKCGHPARNSIGMSTMRQTVKVLRTSARDNEIDPVDAILAVQAANAAGLPRDRKAQYELFAALPEERLAEIFDNAVVAMITNYAFSELPASIALLFAIGNRRPQ